MYNAIYNIGEGCVSIGEVHTLFCTSGGIMLKILTSLRNAKFKDIVIHECKTKDGEHLGYFKRVFKFLNESTFSPLDDCASNTLLSQSLYINISNESNQDIGVSVQEWRGLNLKVRCSCAIFFCREVTLVWCWKL